jgi:hypothetical protein
MQRRKKILLLLLYAEACAARPIIYYLDVPAASSDGRQRFQYNALEEHFFPFPSLW